MALRGFKPGDVVLFAMRQADGSIKSRPVVLIGKTRPFGDWIVAGISTQIQHKVSGVDILINPEDGLFASMGLRQTSIVRTAWLETVAESKLAGSLGRMDKSSYHLLVALLASLASSFTYD